MVGVKPMRWTRMERETNGGPVWVCVCVCLDASDGHKEVDQHQAHMHTDDDGALVIVLVVLVLVDGWLVGCGATTKDTDRCHMRIHQGFPCS